MNSNDIIKKIKNEFLNNKESIESIIILEKKNWDYNIEFDKLVEIFDKYENKELVLNSDFKNTSEIISGIGKLAIVNQSNPYSILSMILITIRTNNEVVFFLPNKLLGINSVLIEIASKISSKIRLINSNSNEDFYREQEKFDCVIYFGNKYEYIEFSKRLKIKSIFENSGEIYVYIDDRSFKNEFLNLDKFAYYNDINVRYYSDNFEKSVKSMNDFGVIKNAVIYTKNKDMAREFLEQVKAEKVYVNSNPCNDFEFDFDEKKITYMKKLC